MATVAAVAARAAGGGEVIEDREGDDTVSNKHAVLPVKLL
jgi:hypothetical protein